VILERLELDTILFLKKKIKNFVVFFSISKLNHMPFVTYNYCMKNGHVLKNYNVR